MTDAIVKGTYSDFKLVKTRKVIQMIIEIPVENHSIVTERFGIPQPHEEKWVAVALLDTRKSEDNTRARNAIQQAGILGKDVAFGTFLKDKVPETIPTDPKTIAQAIRTLTGVKSRSDFKTDERALISWERLVEEYNQKI